MRLSLSSIAGSIGILLVAIVLSVSCRPDAEPVIPEGAVDMGDYYAWGETQPYYAAGHSQDNPCTDWRSGKNGYYWNSYKWCNGDNYKLTRYCPMEKTGDWDGSGKPTYAWYLFTKKGRYVGEYCSSRYYGNSVRPVTEE